VKKYYVAATTKNKRHHVVSRIAYQVSREEKELEKKEDRKTKAINILFSF